MTQGYQQIHEGEWIQPNKKGFIHQCCDCKLVHITDYAVVDSNNCEIPGARVQFKLKVDRRKTSAARRAFKFEKEGD